VAAAREEWGTRLGFLLAAIGSAVGLGNIWRFPYVAWDSGGGAFFVPYLFALLTAGIPLLVLEYAIGHRHRGSAPLSLRRVHRRAEWIGWWQIAVCFLIASYYSVVIAWAASYTWFSVGTRWSGDPEAFFFEDYLGVTEAGTVGGMRVGVLVPLVALWAITLVVLSGGVRKGIERANRIMIPLLLVLFLIIVIRAVTLDGSAIGLDALFRPDWSRIGDSDVWVAAYGQIFFSLSIGFAIMITYASYLPRKGDLTGNAFIAGFSNASFELLAGIGVFAAIGFLVASTGVAVDEVARDGIGLAFVVFPEIISQMPGPSGLYGVLFFGSLVLAGLSSLISITQTYIAAIQEKFSLTRRRSVALAGGGTALVSLVYATGGGINTLDVVDRFINAFGIAAVGLVEVIVVAWFVRSLPRLRHHANRVSDLRLGLWWIAALGVITPVVLGWMTIDNLMTEFETPYEGYPMTFLVVFGWGVAGLALVVGLALSFAPWPDDIDIRAPHEPDEPHGGLGPSGPGSPPESAGGTEPAEPTEPAQPTDRGTEGAS
jgi:neurotransmitter:Na+ symporter, NSS family